MMPNVYWGYAQFGDTEVTNVARLVKYVAEGAAPTDLLVTPNVGPYEDLPSALGHEPYRTPILDSPAWYDETNPDSASFAGLLILDMTGLNGTTRRREVTEGLTDGGKPGSSRAPSRTIAVTALAIAAGDAALEAGLDWLTGALHPPCSTDFNSCRGVPLSLFSAAPTYCDALPDPDADPVTDPLIGAPVTADGPSLSYYDLFQAYLSPLCGEVTVEAVVRISETDPLDPFGRTVRLSLMDATGEVYAAAETPIPANGDPVTIEVTYDPTPGFPNEWQPILSWYGPEVIDAGDADDEPPVIIDAGDADPALPDVLDGGDADEPGGLGTSVYGGELTIDTWTYTHQPVLTADDCLTELRRSYRNVVTVDGPTVVDEWPLADGTPYAAVVEWTWSATDPVPYGDTIDLLQNLAVGRLGQTAYAGSTGNVDLTTPYFTTGILAGHMALDGVQIPPGSDVVIKNQTDATENGLYTFPAYFSSLVRSTRMDNWDTEVVDSIFYLQNGDTQAGQVWGPDVVTGGTLDVTSMPWVLVSGGVGSVYDNSVGYQAPGLQLSTNADVTGAATACDPPSPVLVLCGDDPDLPVIVAPPEPPTLTDPGMPAVTTYARREIQVPPELSPQPSGVLTMSVTSLSDDPYRGIRVRLWSDPDPDFGVVEECDWATEFYITHLAAGQTVTINGPDHTVTTTCLSGLDDDHERNMRGPYGGPFQFPELRCGDRYHIAIDVPVGVGDDAGVVVDLAVTRRGV